MAETNSLLNCRTGNCTGGSNPPLSAPLKNRVFRKSTVTIHSFSGRGAVRLAHLLWEQGVEGSNPFAPTENQQVTEPQQRLVFFVKDYVKLFAPHRPSPAGGFPLLFFTGAPQDPSGLSAPSPAGGRTAQGVRHALKPQAGERPSDPLIFCLRNLCSASRSSSGVLIFLKSQEE